MARSSEWALVRAAGRGTGGDVERAAGPRAGDGVRAVLGMTGVMWALEVLDVVLRGRLDRLGIVPRDLGGLLGVVLAPFLHTGFGHLIGNTVPFVAMGLVIALGGLLRVVAVTAVAGLVSGLGIWLVGPDRSLTIGASGLVFGYAAYLIVRGAIGRSLLQLALGLVVVAVLGTSLLAGLVPTPGVSWQGHLFGAVGGVLAARLLHRRRSTLTAG